MKFHEIPVEAQCAIISTAGAVIQKQYVMDATSNQAKRIVGAVSTAFLELYDGAPEGYFQTAAAIEPQTTEPATAETDTGEPEKRSDDQAPQKRQYNRKQHQE